MATEEKKDKKKKEKITYIDDGRSFADMSNVTGGFGKFGPGTTSSLKDIWETYWMAVKMMFKPMLVVIGFLCVIFGIAALAFLIM
ncbi:MAG: hypothetical protein J6B96_04570 [Agathobacter sp.]|nr:hypothetical protein [Agathobacter sp.]